MKPFHHPASIITDGPFSYIQVKTVCLKCRTSTSMQRDPSLHGWDVLFHAVAVLWGSLFPSPHENMSFCLPHSRRAQVLGLISRVCFFQQAQTLVGCCLDGRDWHRAREVLPPEGPITGSSLRAVKLDNKEQREQQRRQRQVKAPNVTQDKKGLPLSQFEV